jgi:hypothetical protein
VKCDLVPPLWIAKKGKIKQNLVEFWRFDYYMFCNGTYYAPVGTSPQDGEHEAVQKIINAAKEVIDAKIKEREEW